MLQHCTRAGWSVTIRRIAECMCGQLPLLSLLALPILIPVLFGMEHVYPWADHTVVRK